MKFYIITGEPSGDLHAANLVEELKKCNNKLEFRAWGGERLLAQGVELAKHIKETAFMGLLDVLKNLGAIKENFNYCKQDILKYKPDALILVDYPGFNLKIAKFAKQQGIKVLYYISPKVWAWNKSRVSKIQRYVDELLVIFPFEVDFYQKYGMKVTYVGNPLLDEIGKGNFSFSYSTEKPIIALLPGSRKQEITKMLSVMLSLITDFSEYQFVIAGAPSQDFSFYKQIIGEREVAFINNKTYDLLSVSYAALVASGTATLETALFKVPQVVCYKGGYISYQIAKRIITLKFISLVNLILDKEVVKELIQEDFNKQNLKVALTNILELSNRENIFLNYFDLEKQLGGKGASKNVASQIVAALK